jgi:hypothetical protein
VRHEISDGTLFAAYGERTAQEKGPDCKHEFPPPTQNVHDRDRTIEPGTVSDLPNTRRSPRQSRAEPTDMGEKMAPGYAGLQRGVARAGTLADMAEKGASAALDIGISLRGARWLASGRASAGTVPAAAESTRWSTWM